MKILYTAVATATGGREGKVSTSDGTLDLELAYPKEIGGPGTPGATNPEQLFAAGYAGCFHSALQHVARRKKMDATGSWVSAHVGLGMTPEGYFLLDAELHIGLPALSREEADQLVATAHKVCPYSNATRGTLDVRLVIEEPAAVAKD